MGTVPTYRDWVQGQFMQTSYLNGDIRDNGRFLASPPTCTVSRLANQSIPNATTTKIDWRMASQDNDAMADLANDNIVIKTGGLYVLQGFAEYDTHVTGVRTTQIVTNALGTVVRDTRNAVSGSNTSVSLASQPVRLAVGDIVYMYVYQTSGTAIFVQPSVTLSAEWVGV